MYLSLKPCPSATALFHVNKPLYFKIKRRIQIQTRLMNKLMLQIKVIFRVIRIFRLSFKGKNLYVCNFKGNHTNYKCT